MTRIVGGRLSGRRLVAPGGDATRPTSAMVRAAIGNALHATGGLAGAAVLDLYAGTGALGFEMASRGAARVVMVENARAAQNAIRTNLTALGDGSMTLYPGDALAFAATGGDRFDVVLADPPYATPNEALAAVLTALLGSGRLTPGADIVIERSARDGEFPWPPPLLASRTKRYGDTLVCYGHAP